MCNYGVTSNKMEQYVFDNNNTHSVNMSNQLFDMVQREHQQY